MGRGVQPLSPRTWPQVDFYGASSLLPLTDEQLLRRVQQRYLATADPAYASARITDSWWVGVDVGMGVGIVGLVGERE